MFVRVTDGRLGAFEEVRDRLPDLLLTSVVRCLTGLERLRFVRVAAGRAAARLAGLERRCQIRAQKPVAQRREHLRVHRVRIAPAHLDLRRVHVDVDCRRIDSQGQEHHRIAVGFHQPAIGFAHRRPHLEQLAAARAALLEEMEGKKEERMIDKWVGRIVEPKARMRLFFAGAGLVLITFMFFGTVRE